MTPSPTHRMPLQGTGFRAAIVVMALLAIGFVCGFGASVVVLVAMMVDATLKLGA